MKDIEKKLDQLRQAYEAGIMDKETYRSMLNALGVETVGDNIDISAGNDAVFAKDGGKATAVRDSWIGVIGDNTHIQGGIHYHIGEDLPEKKAALLRRWLIDLASETDRLPWGRLSPEEAGPERGESLRLSDVYTSLDTTEPERMDCEDDVRQCLLHSGAGERVSAQRMLNGHERLVLLGDPGSGKTTLVNFLAHIMACAGVAEKPDDCLGRLKKIGPWDHGPLLPLRVVLRDFAFRPDGDSDTPWNLITFIRKMLADNGLDDLWPEIHKGLQDEKSPFLILLDGLDEVPADIRGEAVKIIDDFAEKYPHNRYLVTCRIYAYVDPAFRLRNFRRTVLSPFSGEQVNQFIDAWYGELAAQKRMSKTDADKLAKRLKTAVVRSDIGALAERPIIMTVMALLHTSYGQLPEDRVELYRWAVDLLFRRWKGRTGGEKSLMATLDMPQLRMSDLEAGLYHAAFQAHSGHGNIEGTADIAEEVLTKQLKPYLGGSWDKAALFIGYVRERAGLLIRHKPEAYTFPHRTFQEFMAACHLTGLKDYPREAARLIKENPDLWRIVFVLAAGHAARTHQLGNAISSAVKLCPLGMKEVEKPDAEAFTRAVIAGEALLEIGLVGVEREEDGGVILDRVRQWLLEAMIADDILQPQDRVHAGNVLSRLGDPRFDPDNWYLPVGEDMGFVRIPEGEFLMGTGEDVDIEPIINDLIEFYESRLPEKDRAEGYKEGYRQLVEAERPQHAVTVSEFAVSRYPVTVAQFYAFLKNSGYEWEGKGKSGNRYGNHPVVNVSWHDAAAYCKWLTEKLKEKNMIVALPTEAQWEKVARGEKGNVYPWGDDPAIPNRLNFYDTGIGSTAPVGCFPGGDSPYGLSDMAGNVWEWCNDWHDFHYYSNTPSVDPAGPENGSVRVIRGGSWHDSSGDCRAASRSWNLPGLRDLDLGFRLVLPGQ